MSLPMSAEVSVNCVPANCMPSPESPQKRIVTAGIVVTRLAPAAAVVVGVAVAVTTAWPLPLPLPLELPLAFEFPLPFADVAGDWRSGPEEGLLIMTINTRLPVRFLWLI